MKLNKDNFTEKLGTWFPSIEPLFDNGTMNEIFGELKRQSKAGITITPESDNLFRCFRETPIDNLKVVMMGLCPYHSVVHGKLVADGLLMGCSNHSDYVAPSLRNYYEAVEEEFKEGLCLPCVQDGDVGYLARQGVLMFNSALTTVVGEKEAHQELWRPFTEHMMGIFNKMMVPVIFLGSVPWEFSDCCGLHYKLTHPASVCYQKENKKWDSQGVFRSVNQKLEEWYQNPIQWIMETPPF